jgi:hypothetical protein
MTQVGIYDRLVELEERQQNNQDIRPGEEIRNENQPLEEYKTIYRYVLHTIGSRGMCTQWWTWGPSITPFKGERCMPVQSIKTSYIPHHCRIILSTGNAELILAAVLTQGKKKPQGTIDIFDYGKNSCNLIRTFTTSRKGIAECGSFWTDILIKFMTMHENDSVQIVRWRNNTKLVDQASFEQVGFVGMEIVDHIKMLTPTRPKWLKWWTPRDWTYEFEDIFNIRYIAISDMEMY